VSYDQEGPVVAKTKKLLEFRTAAAGIAAGLAISVIYKKNDIVEFLNHAEVGEVQYVGVLQAISVVVVIVLAILWIHTGTEELEDLQFWLRPLSYKPIRPTSQAFSIFVIAVLLAVTLCLVDQIAFFVTFYCIYLAADLYSWKVRRDEIMAGFTGSLAALEERIQQFLSSQHPEVRMPDHEERVKARLAIYFQGCQAIHAYYMERPHYRRIAILLGLFLLAAIPANYIHIYHQLHLDQVKADNSAVPLPFGLGGPISNFQALAGAFYVYWLVLVIASEFILNLVWRQRLKSRLEELRDRLERIPPG
jgi:hypothetical protein